MQERHGPGARAVQVHRHTIGHRDREQHAGSGGGDASTSGTPASTGADGSTTATGAGTGGGAPYDGPTFYGEVAWLLH